MLPLLIILHIVVCLILILVVLLQTGKGADLASAFGMTGSQTAFGPRGATSLLSKATAWAAIIFMFTSLSLYMLESRRGRSSIQEPAPAGAPASPAPSAAPAAPAPGSPAGESSDSGQTGGGSPGPESSKASGP